MNSTDQKEWLPSVSVIIPSYNAQSTIEQTLQSLMEQDYMGPTEIIVVDDGSTDATSEISRKYADKVFIQDHKGPGMARNRGVEESSGEVLIFTDSDCILSKQFVSELVKPLGDPLVAGVQGRYVGRDTAIIARFIQHEYEERARRQAKVDNVYWVATHSACYRRDAFLSTGGFGTFSRGQDLDLSQRMERSGLRLVFNPDAIVYHHHPTTLGKYIRGKFTRAYWMIALYKKFPERIVKDPITPVLRKLMMVFLTIGVVAIPLAFVMPVFTYICLASWILLILSTLPFTIRTFLTDPLVGLISPIMMILRTGVFIIGFATGLLAYITKREFNQDTR